ncbi:VOC family protein [Brevibacterium spongiae]|uniref:Putative pterin-4-alpha-carbinolamine dehydratase n=1 Tax=Brevibacterium spongiae TaxID=2909672 RepID=A0ABY5SK44_9MICO|nr:VOC family protein [Brevibacterium spongiae]UVI34822.1 4a-hydroxytetrahydrobiopterin dehydratase [Brevibacterium spongiae]
MNEDVLSSARIARAGLDDWRQLAGPIRARFLTANFAQAHEFAGAVGAAAESAGLAPEITLTASNVIVTVSSADERGVTAADVDLARTISELAAEAGLQAAPASLQQAEFALDTASSARIAGFYAAVLDAESDATHSNGGLIDPTGQVNTGLWWQEPRTNSRFPLPEPETPQRWHLDVWVGHDEAQNRIASALAAGGRLVSDAAAPSYWVLEDPDGNRVCLCAPMVE